MKTVTMELPTSKSSLVSKIMEVKMHDKVHSGEEIIRNLKNIRINDVAVQGDSLRIYGNHIECGFVEKRDVVSDGKKIGITFYIEDKTAELWNSDAFKNIQFEKNDILYRFTFEYDF